MEWFVLNRGDVTIPVTVYGTGPPAVLVPGPGLTVALLEDLVDALRGFLRLAAFDVRGHGRSTAAHVYGYPACAEDVAAVTAAVGPPEPMVMIGCSAGADLLLDHAAMLPAGPRALVLVDGAPAPDGPLYTEQERAQGYRRLREAPRATGRWSGPQYQNTVPVDEMIDLMDQVEARRRSTAERIDRVHGPITMIVSEGVAGNLSEAVEDPAGGGMSMARAREINAGWLAAFEDLAATRPAITVRRVDAGPVMVLTHPEQVAAHVREACAAAPAPSP